ncbi:hypothetical protein CAPTEDRAFT_177924 [Capitella teleta]|uniref:non-specific serine/threonine protein kinase n=1 Tax=Capitella teleta TaxID=283909 RepID=R7TCR7_CAPTE|nr:hypothetical protein CAPTEDRAFT_177924 [Capitella teleta]|eukprot:ELT89257.1 hypothetical protein CAPTEDRAFT_177924 [Capitella teleta]
MPLPKRIPRSGSAKSKDASSVVTQRILANRYAVEKKLGSGNFGTVWMVKDSKAKDEKEKKKALKEIPVGDMQPDETLEASHEAKLLRNLDHPGIVKFYDSFIDGEFFCIVTEFCDGGDLGSKIVEYRERSQHLQEGQVLEWLIQLLLAVQYIHDRRVLHRDLKSNNIFLRNNMVKLGDFGISRILMGTSDMASTFVGTPYYMSPEVLKHEGYNSKSDVWSIGCILYELVTLDHAFQGQSLMGIMYKIVEGDLPPWPEEYSNDLGSVFTRICEKDPAKRASASEALKLPYISKQMEMLKNTMMGKHIAKAQRDTVNRESKQLATALKENQRIEEIRRESEEQKWKNLSPRERMRLRKQMEADMKAKRIEVEMQQQFLANKASYSENKQHQNPFETQLLNAHWAKSRSKSTGAPPAKGSASNRQHSQPDISRPMTAPLGGSYERHAADEESDEDSSDDDVIIPHRHTMHGYRDDRPITPMQNTMIYNPDRSSLDFKDGIPETPDLAETYYSQFEDDFEAEAEDDGEATLVAAEETEDLIHYMQTALNQADTTLRSSTMVADDSTLDAFGPSVRDIRIKNLRAEAGRKLGASQFEQVYQYLKRVRFPSVPSAASTLNEGEIMRGLRQIVNNPNDCFIVDQLLFLEAQADMSNKL